MSIRKKSHRHIRHRSSVEPCTKHDFVVVVGTNKEVLSNWKNLGRYWIGLNPYYGNKMVFFAQAIRSLRLNIQAPYRELIYFDDEYSDEQISEVQKSALKYVTNERFIKVSSRNELLAAINAESVDGTKCKRIIRRLEIYAHGFDSDIEFGLTKYVGSDPVLAFKRTNVTSIDKTKFDKDSLIASYACQTANNGNYDNAGLSGVKGSLAEVLSDHTGATVRAWARRTEYDMTWGAPSSLAETDKGLVVIPGKFPVLWHPEGALDSVREGVTPEGAPAGLWQFAPGSDPERIYDLPTGPTFLGNTPPPPPPPPPSSAERQLYQGFPPIP